VAGQVALSLMLIVGAVLFGRSLRSALTTPVGVDAGRIAYATVSFWRAGYDEARLARFNQTIVERMSGHPGIERATFGALQLAENTGSVVRLRIDGADRQLPRTLTFPCGPDYFATIGIPIVVGRALSADDGKAGAPPALVVNEAFAQQAWAGANPLGRRVIIHPAGPEFQVVGVARNGKYGSLSEEGRLALYLPWHLERRSPDGARVTFVIRSGPNAPGGVQSLQQQIRLADPALPIFAAGTLEDRIAALAMPQRIGASLLGWFSVVAFALAVLGIYGLIAQLVTRRTNEIGVHIALGARPSDVVRLMMSRSLVPVVAGVVAGVGGAYALTRFATAFLFGIAPHDPFSFAAATVFLLLFAALASYLPARRAAHIDPIIALRAE
jgi:predicted permease